MQQRHWLVLGSSLLAAGCGDSNGPGTLHGPYAATTFLSIFQAEAEPDTFDILGNGGKLRLHFEADSMVTGVLAMPKSGTDTFTGYWAEESGTVRLRTNPPTILEDLRFKMGKGTLVADMAVQQLHFVIRLHRE